MFVMLPAMSETVALNVYWVRADTAGPTFELLLPSLPEGPMSTYQWTLPVGAEVPAA